MRSAGIAGRSASIAPPRKILQNALGHTISGANPLQAFDVKAYGLAS